MSGRKGMLHYKVEIKQEAVRLVLEEHLTYAAVAVLFLTSRPRAVRLHRDPI
jgi:transposase-like protein